METLSKGIVCTGRINNLNADCRVFAILLRCLTESGCRLQTYSMSGNASKANINFTVTGSPEELRLFSAAYDGAVG